MFYSSSWIFGKRSFFIGRLPYTKRSNICQLHLGGHSLFSTRVLSVTLDCDKINELDQKHAPTAEYKDKVFSYGTAGFRTHGDALDNVCFRVGLIAAIRASQTGASGVMITASHNPPQDNGVKIVDNSGYMVDQSWEDPFTDAVNAKDPVEYCKNLINEKQIQVNKDARVSVACDTRDSSPRLVAALIAGITAMGVTVKDFGQLSTPQLHFLVWFANKEGYSHTQIDEMTEDLYYDYYQKNLQEYYKIIKKAEGTTKFQKHLVVDTANGIGGPQLKKLELYKNAKDYGLNFVILNDGSTGTEYLNSKCGAECVQKDKSFPLGSEEIKSDDSTKWVSFDGDADRIVYYYGNPSTNELNVIDGDKLAILLGDYINSLMGDISNDKGKLSDLITYIVVQTGYANSSATQYLTKKGVKVGSVPTGVKHLHHKAEQYDIGVYFEANGHGTVISKYEKIVGILKDNGFNLEDAAVNKFLKFLLLTNEAVGDAMATLLMVEAFLMDSDLDTKSANAIYTDLPSKMLKFEVKDRSKFKTQDDNETILVEPAGLQEVIEGVFKEVENSRAFVRPSGTEDVVRIYAEAPTQEQADEIADKITNILSTDYKDY